MHIYKFSHEPGPLGDPCWMDPVELVVYLPGFMFDLIISAGDGSPAWSPVLSLNCVFRPLWDQQ